MNAVELVYIRALRAAAEPASHARRIIPSRGDAHASAPTETIAATISSGIVKYTINRSPRRRLCPQATAQKSPVGVLSNRTRERQ
jgi:hypothetical protein